MGTLSSNYPNSNAVEAALNRANSAAHEITLLSEDVVDIKERLDTFSPNIHNPDDYICNIHVSQSVINEVLACALSYYKKGNLLVYGNGYTANNDVPARAPYNIPADERQYREDAEEETSPEAGDESQGDEPTTGGEDIQDSEFVPDEPSESSSGEMRLQLDCSSFVWLVYSGVPFEYSKYASPQKTTNDRFYSWGLDWLNKSDYYDNTTTQARMLANAIARYCDDKGWGFTPKLDATNLQAGDLVFFIPYDNNQTPNESYYMGITHVGIYMWTNGYGQSMIFDCSTSDPNRPVRVRVISTKYRGCIVRAARLPLTEVRSTKIRSLSTGILPQKGITYSNEAVKKFISLKTELKPSTFYTVGVKISQAENQHPQSIAFIPYGTPAAYDRITKPNIKTYDGYYESHFFVTLNGEIINRPDGRLPVDTLDGVNIYEYSYYQEGDDIPTGKHIGDYISDGCIQTNTKIEFAEICEGLYKLSHDSRIPTTDEWHTYDIELSEDSAGIIVPINNEWVELYISVYAIRSSTDSDYLQCFVEGAESDSQRLIYIPLESSTKVLCRGSISRVDNGEYFASKGSYNNAATSETSPTVTPYNRSIYTSRMPKSLKINLSSESELLTGSIVKIEYR